MMNFDKNSKTDRVLAASLKCFKQYGFKRTSMEDIAQVADMSRPALYILFKNKTDIFRSLSERFQDFTLDAVQNSLAEDANIQTRLTKAILSRIAPFYVLAQGSVHGPELFDLTKSTAADINTNASAKFLSLIEVSIKEAISDGQINTQSNTLNATELAQIITTSAFGIKEAARDLAHYEDLLTKMIAVLFLGLAPK